ncbi:MAG: fungal-specific transcription factor domain-containing protein [Linnemannia gamsii]|nr:MAG: fungal-specific transcription factor domain-containing protein [Linnemannia gamsii]
MFSSPMLLDFNSNSKRSKITKACDNCRRRRVKCDGTPDGCGGCKAAKTTCVYTTSNTKRGPPKGYVEVIEDRLGKIENMLAGIVRKKKTPSTSTNNRGDRATTVTRGSDNEDNDDDDNNDDNDNASIASTDLVEVKRQPPASPTLRGRSGSATAGPLGHPRHSPLVSRNRSLTSLLPFSQESQLQHHMEAQANYPGPVSQADMAALTDMFEQLGTTSVRTTVPFPWLTPEQSQHYGRNYLQFTAQSLEPPLPALARSFSSSLSPDATLELLNSFFDTFNTFLPLLHRPTFMKQWDRQACQFCSSNYHQHINKKHTQPQPHEAEAHKAHLQDPVAPLSPLLLNALLAIASKVPSTQASQSLETSQGFFDATRLLLDDFLDVPRVSTVQALCLMSQFHHQGQWKATRSSSYLSLAIRMAHELGLNRDPEVASGPEADALRYLWWSMFILDHQFSAWLGLGLLMHGKESNVELPMDVTSSQQDLRGFVCLVRLVKILGSVLQHSYSTQSLPPQFGGHDSMVSYIEGSLTSWLSNLSPEMRWLHPNNTSGRRGSPASPMRSPDAIRSAAGLDRVNGDIYPAYLNIVYNTTLILLHRPYIVGAAGSPTAAQSNTICTGSGRAITDIAQGLEISRCSYVVNRFALYALLQAGVIHAMNAVYDKRGTEVAMEYYTRTVRILEGFLACAAYSGGVAEGIKVIGHLLLFTVAY